VQRGDAGTNLAMILKDMGQAAEAKPLLQRALASLEGMNPNSTKGRMWRASMAS